MPSNLALWTQLTCLVQQLTSLFILRHTFTPHASFVPPDARFEVIHIDLVGPLPVSRNSSISCVDRFTRWPEAFPLIDITAESVAHAFGSGKSGIAWTFLLRGCIPELSTYMSQKLYTRLTKSALMDKDPIRHLQDFSSSLHDDTVFSKIDLVQAYHQIPVAPEDIQKTAISASFRLFEFVRMPFGLKNAAQTFQRFMDEVMGRPDFCYTYIDDLLVASSSLAEHKIHLRRVFERLSAYGSVFTWSLITLCLLRYHV